MLVINPFFGFKILQLGMMGTSVLYNSGDAGVAGFTANGDHPSVCLNSQRMSWALKVLSCNCFVLTFVYEVQEDVNGTVFSPSFPVRAYLASLILTDQLLYFSLCVRT